MSGIHSFHPTVILHGGNTAVVSDLGGQFAAQEMQGFFAGDTRMLSTYKFDVNGCAWRLLARSRLGHGSARWHFQNPELRDLHGELAPGLVSFTLERRVAGAMHDDLTIESFAGRPVHLRLILQLDADFADIFEVKSRTMPPRMNLLRIAGAAGLVLAYEGPAGFRRALHVSLHCPGTVPSFAGSRIGLDVRLAHAEKWRCCVEAVPEIDGRKLHCAGDPHRPEPTPVPADAVGIECAPLLKDAFDRGHADLHSLAMGMDGRPPFIAAGAPWFLSLFGRDTLVTALMAGVAGSGPAEACLDALGRLQGLRRDDFRDEEPGKIAHELRRDERTRRGELPYSPYYGTHDAPALYCLTLWHAWRWSGSRALLDAHLGRAAGAMAWCDGPGDRDGDGLLEYETRSPKGYRNQGWKDAGDAIVDARGRQARLPIATVELQGYLYAARLAMAELCDAAGRAGEAERLRERALRLREAVEARFWLEQEQFYALALDGDKRPVDAVASNAGHLLWCGLPDGSRARAVARRLLQPDLFSGWGLRTLSSANPAYNPLSYQLGSVWPHDTLLAAAGLWRYGLREEASRLVHAILRAAQALEDHRLPELFCGFDADAGFPVPYEQANIPQAWAAAVPLLAAQLLMGLVPDAPHGRCFASPWLPSWLPRLALRGVRVGEGRFDISAARQGEQTVIESVTAQGVDVVTGVAEAPLFGRPIELPQAILGA
jgi:glycogen debranching enzyme